MTDKKKQTKMTVKVDVGELTAWDLAHTKSVDLILRSGEKVTLRIVERSFKADD